MTTQTHYSGFPAALARGGTFDLGDPVSQWWLSRLPVNPHITIAAFRLIANVSSSAIDITTITRYTTGYAVVWQNRMEGTFQIDANNARASGIPTVTYQSYTTHHGIQTAAEDPQTINQQLTKADHQLMTFPRVSGVNISSKIQDFNQPSLLVHQTHRVHLLQQIA
ncbi:MAG: hypothetical protein FJY58_09990 [Betaproteobacteria bacterium]|nr:hypothetical protein [Betaproteobacteria bacterium]